MDKIAMYEEMILDSVFEKEASRAIDRYAKKLLDIEKKTGLTYRGHSLVEKAKDTSHVRDLYDIYTNTPYRDAEKALEFRWRAKDFKRDVGLPLPSNFNTGRSVKGNTDVDYGTLKDILKKKRERSHFENSGRKYIKDNYPELNNSVHLFKKQ